MIEPAAAGAVSPIFHIGLHKTGTSWLQRQLFDHPGNNLRAIGELFGARRELVWPRPFEFDAAATRARYRPMFEAAVAAGEVPLITDERFSGNPFSGGYDTKEIADRIHAAFPEARIVIVIREQRAMLLSTYDQYVREGGGASLHDWMFPRTRHAVPGFRFEYFEYDKIIGYYQRLFGPERVRVLTFETFRDAPAMFVEQLLRFCGARADNLPNPAARVNKGRNAATLSVERRLNPFLVRDDVNGRSPLAVTSLAWRVRPLAAFVAGRVPGAMDTRIERGRVAAIAAAAAGRYEVSNRETQISTGLDLAGEGYAC